MSSQNFSKSLKLVTRLKLAAHSILSDAVCRPDGTINRHIGDFIDATVPPSSTPKDDVTTSDIIIDPSRNLWFRLFLPTSPSPSSATPIIIYFHGGGFIFFTPATTVFDTHCRRFAKELSCIVISINYRHSPEHKYPSQYEDGFDALKFIDENQIDGIPTDALSRCFLAGDSAGGNLAHHVTIKASESNFRVINIKGLLLFQPFFGGEERTESEIRLKDNPRLPLKRTDWAWKVFLPDGCNRDHPAVNVYGGQGGVDLSRLNFPLTLVVVGGLDILQDRQRKYCEWLRGSGKDVELVEYDEMFHGFYVFTELKESGMLINEVKGFVHKHIQHVK